MYTFHRWFSVEQSVVDRINFGHQTMYWIDTSPHLVDLTPEQRLMQPAISQSHEPFRLCRFVWF